MRRILQLVLVTCLTACAVDVSELYLLPVGDQRLDTDAIQGIFEQKSSVRIRPADGVNRERPALELLAADKVDLAFVQNSNAFVPGVRVVLPAHKSLMHLLAREDLEGAEVDVALRGKTVYIVNNSQTGRTLLQVAARRRYLTDSDYRIVDTFVPGETDLLLYFGPVVAGLPPWYQPGYRFTTFQRAPGQHQESNPELISYLIPHMFSVTIPASTYDIPGNEIDIPTFGTDTLLVTRKDISENAIYELTRTLLEQKPRFTALAPQLFEGVNESFDPLELSFPLHRGARRYLARDEPSFLERYAEMINMLVYVTFLLLTGLLALARWRMRRKKDRIDTFYRRVLAIRDRAIGEDHGILLVELAALEQEAFDALIDERLAANESFRIFTDLMVRTRAELKSD
ncbi:MAG: TAXI family TRAP transporter solute-binding subunit [Halieaceae bacterium]|nr:TAXI family TRAP transporter solute-binding subunit [Halieaceae bacterium]